jgi:phage tail sheath protein FI
MSTTAAIPGLYYTFVKPARTQSPLRTDVAGFFGRTQRGPVGTPVRVEGWREYVSVFGGLTEDAMTPYAVRGYFDNGAEAAHVVRLLGATAQTATGVWNAGFADAAGKLNADWPGASGLTAIQFQIAASSPGDWANQTSVNFRYWVNGATGKPEIQIEINPPNETQELLTGIDPASLVDEVNQRSAYIRMTANPLPAGVPAKTLIATVGPRYFEWLPSVTLSGGTPAPPTKEDYLDAVRLLGDIGEVALVVSPDLYHNEFSNEADQIDVITAQLTQADQLHDRLVIIDVPPKNADPLSAVQWVQKLRVPLTEDVLRNGAVYHPRLLVPDPLGSVPNALKCTPSSGCVTGVISRLDLQQGAYLTPANAPIEEALDLSKLLKADEQAIVYGGGMNLLTCSPSRGLLVWGGRVLGKSSLGGFVAHRRLIHLLVRAIRRVAEPLVFDTNGPELWLAFVRSITTVLLEAYRAGALQGVQPSQAFQVICDATTNPPEQIDQGTVVCNVKIAPAVPMEFITLRVAVSAQGQLEVFES